MSVLWIEGFETDRNAATWDKKYTGGQSNNSATSSVTGRFGGVAVRADNNLMRMSTTALGLRNTLVFGIAYRASAPLEQASFVKFTGQGGIVPLELRQRQISGKIRFELRSKGVSIFTTRSFDYGKWVYLEVWTIFQTPASQINTIFRVNGTTVYQGAVNNGVNAAAPGFTEFELFGQADSGGYVDLDDFYLLDHVGTPSYFLDTGYSTTIEGLFPNTVGTHSEWEPNGVTFNFQAVDEGSAGIVNDDTDYNLGDNDTELDLHGMSDLRYINGKIHAVEFSIDAKAASGSAVVDFLIQTENFAPNEIGSPNFQSDSQYNRARYLLAENPSSGIPFVPMSLRDSQIGYGAKENFKTVTTPVDPPPPEGDYDYGTTTNPTGTEADFGTTTNPSGPDADFGTT